MKTIADDYNELFASARPHPVGIVRVRLRNGVCFDVRVESREDGVSQLADLDAQLADLRTERRAVATALGIATSWVDAPPPLTLVPGGKP